MLILFKGMISGETAAESKRLQCGTRIHHFLARQDLTHWISAACTSSKALLKHQKNSTELVYLNSAQLNRLFCTFTDLMNKVGALSPKLCTKSQISIHLQGQLRFSHFWSEIRVIHLIRILLKWKKDICEIWTPNLQVNSKA